MATGSPIPNGEIPLGHAGTLEETLQQMNILIQENRDLKGALQQTNQSMKERFEGLSAWREKQREERGFLESSLEKSRTRLETLATENQELRAKVDEKGGGGQAAKSASAIEALCAQLARLQAEKNDLVAMNSELQLTAGQRADEDSFIEIVRVVGNGVGHAGGAGGEEQKLSGKLEASMAADLTVSNLLQSLRNETQSVERLQLELQASETRVAALQDKMICTEMSTQTSLPPEPPKQQGPGEVETLRSQILTLFNDLQQAQNKLDQAESMKKGLQDRCREVEQDVVTLRAQLVEKQTVQTENERLRVQLDSMQAQSQLEQKKSSEERNNLDQLKEAYTKLFEDYEELKEEAKKKEAESVPSSLVEELHAQLTDAEKALANKQEHIDEMKQEIFQKEKELETISVFQAQAEVYSSDFYAERAAREKIHEEKEVLATELDYTKKLNLQLQEELESLGRHGLNEMQKRHVPRGGNPHGGAAAQGGRGGDGREWQQQQMNIQEHVCPKCSVKLPDLDTLQIHIMDCII
ncbi:hypothetical protein CRUP_030217 [Coryphaenoides rupestris]|nr:hypothetical protein CRUP_030217 [Coryphaenoides rupestris]